MCRNGGESRYRCDEQLVYLCAHPDRVWLIPTLAGNAKGALRERSTLTIMNLYASPPALERAAATLADQLHEEWRAPRLRGDGTFEPRVKSTRDQEWVAAHGGVSEVDIANTDYAELPQDWQRENLAAARSVIHAIAGYVGNGGEVIDIGPDHPALDEIASRVHVDWLLRNYEWAPPELQVPYSELTFAEKEKDRAIVVAAADLLDRLERDLAHSYGID